MTPVGTLLRYAVVGVATLALYLALGEALRRLRWPMSALASVPFALAVLFNYLLQRGWVFKDHGPSRSSAPRFAAMIALGYTINYLALATLSSWIPLVFAQVVAACLVVVSNAALSFTWVFVHAIQSTDGHKPQPIKTQPARPRARVAQRHLSAPRRPDA